MGHGAPLIYCVTEPRACQQLLSALAFCLSLCLAVPGNVLIKGSSHVHGPGMGKAPVLRELS